MSGYNPDSGRQSFACPVCGDPRNGVIDSREIQDGAKIRRRRECINQHRFSTIEETPLRKFELNDDEREQVKDDPLSVACERAWQASTSIINAIIHNNGIPNGRLIAIEVDKAMQEVRDACDLIAEDELESASVND